MPRHVSIQGFQGSFHKVAARRFFGVQPALLSRATFSAVVAHVANGIADAGLMAMEEALADVRTSPAPLFNSHIKSNAYKRTPTPLPPPFSLYENILFLVRKGIRLTKTNQKA